MKKSRYCLIDQSDIQCDWVNLSEHEFQAISERDLWMGGPVNDTIEIEEKGKEHKAMPPMQSLFIMQNQMAPLQIS